MKNSSPQLKTNVFSYPEHSKKRFFTIKALQKLINILNSKYEINLFIEVEDGHIAYPLFSRFLMKFLHSCKRTYDYLDIKWLSYINWIINAPKRDTLSPIEYLVEQDLKFLKPYLLEAQKNSKNWIKAIGLQFFSLQNLRLKPGQGPWGVSHGEYPFSVAVDTTGYKESIFHEFLHQFGVSEGYDINTKAPLKGCEKCWMQWEAVKGRGLCKKHRNELIGCLKNIKTHR